MNIFKRFCNATFIVLIIFQMSIPVLADKDIASLQQLIDAYVQAVHTNDPAQIKSAWLALDKDEAAKAYMRENMPGVDYLFNIRGLYFELQDYQASRPEYFGKSRSNQNFQGTVDILKEDLSDQAVNKVENFSVSPKERTRRTNREIVMDSKGNPKVDNQSIALSNPNQNRLDNETLINARTDSFYLSKFQKAPDQLVPRGSSFPKSRPPSQADAMVNSASSVLVFKNSSPMDQVVDIYVNAALVGRQVTVSPQGRTFVVYFSPGMNQLRIVGHRFEDEALYVGVSLPQASYVRDAGEWVIRSGQDRQWSVELKLES